MLHDADIREPLFEFLEEKYGKIRILEEKTMGKSRADVVMIKDEAIVGLEIKSDADSYARLSRQVKDYDKYYDYNYVVAGGTHGLHISEHIPEYWGIITVELVDGDLDFYILREASSNPKVKIEKKLEIMWRPELVIIQEHFGMPKYKEKSKDFVVKKIAERCKLECSHRNYISSEAINTIISDILFERDYNNISAVLEEYRRNK